MTKHQKGDGIKPIRCAEDLLGKRFRIPARNVSRGSAGIYDGMILQQVGENLLVELIAPDQQHYVVLMAADAFINNKPPSDAWATPIKIIAGKE